MSHLQTPARRSGPHMVLETPIGQSVLFRFNHKLLRFIQELQEGKVCGEIPPQVLSDPLQYLIDVGLCCETEHYEVRRDKVVEFLAMLRSATFGTMKRTKEGNVFMPDAERWEDEMNAIWVSAINSGNIEAVLTVATAGIPYNPEMIKYKISSGEIADVAMFEILKHLIV